MPDVSKYDHEKDWMAACVPKMIDEGRKQDQAVAACLSMWRRKDEGDKATWDTAYVNSLPDSCFLFIEDGGKKDGEGKTKPRNKRHFPYKDADGKVDLPHLRNAIARIPQSNAPGLTPELKKRLQARARRLLSSAGKAFTTFKAKDGSTWLLTWTTNAFKDRDEELFSTRSIEEYVARHEGDETKGKFQLWHMPGTEFGTIRWQAPVARFLVEAGPFDDTPTGQRFKTFFEQHPDGHEVHAPDGWGTSHGFHYHEGDRADGVYDWFDKAETSILPFEFAANQHNPQPEVLRMNDKQKALLQEIGGDELVASVLKTGEERTKELEEQGIAYKGETEETKAAEAAETAETKAEAEPAPALNVKVISDALHLEELSDTITALTEAVKVQGADLKAVKAQLAEVTKGDAEKVAEKVADLPRFAWFRSSQAAATVLDGTKPEDAALKAKKETPSAVAGIAAKIGGA